MSVVVAMLQTDWTRFTRDRFLFLMSILLLVIYGVIAQVLPEDIQPKWAFATTEAGAPLLEKALKDIDPEQKFALRVFADEQALKNAFDPDHEPPEEETAEAVSPPEEATDDGAAADAAEGDLFVGFVFPPDMKAAIGRGERPVVRVYVDEAMPAENQQVAEAIGKLISLSTLGKLPGSGGGDEETALGPDIPQRTFKQQFRALFAMIVLMMELLAVASLLGRELRGGTVRALLTTTVSVRSYFASKVIFGALLAFVQALIVAAITGGLATNAHLVVLHLMAGALMFTGVGLMVGCKARDLIEIVTWGMGPIILGLIPAVTALLPGNAPLWVKVLPTYPLVEGLLAVGDATPLTDPWLLVGWAFAWGFASIGAAFVAVSRRLR
jgi:ABC-2 type transport system permease protein